MKKIAEGIKLAAVAMITLIGIGTEYAASKGVTLISLAKDIGEWNRESVIESTEAAEEEKLKVDFKVEKAIKDGDYGIVEVSVKPEKIDEFLPVPVEMDYRTETLGMLAPECDTEKYPNFQPDQVDTEGLSEEAAKEAIDQSFYQFTSNLPENPMGQTIEKYAAGLSKKCLPVNVNLGITIQYESSFKLKKDGSLLWKMFIHDRKIKDLEKIACDTVVQPTVDIGGSMASLMGTMDAKFQQKKGQLAKVYKPENGGEIPGVDLRIEEVSCERSAQGINGHISYQYTGKLKGNNIRKYVEKYILMPENKNGEPMSDDEWWFDHMREPKGKVWTINIFYNQIDLDDELRFRFTNWDQDKIYGQFTVKSK